MKSKRIVIVNDGLGPNKGDQAILLSMLDSLKHTLPDALIMTFPNSKMHQLGQYFEFWSALKNADLFIFGGGQEIQDHASVAFLISGLLKITLAKILSRPIFCYAIGVGPVATGLGKLLIRLVLNQVDLITVRDEESRRCLRQLGVMKPPCYVTADPCFALVPANDRRARDIFSSEEIPETNGPRIAIAPRRWFHYRHYLMPMTFRAKFCSLRGQEEYNRLKKLIAKTADHLVATHKAQIIFVPMRSAGGKFDPGQDDDQVSKEIIDLMRFKENVFLLKGDYLPNELKAFLGHMDLVIGMRMHSLIMGSMMGVPVMGIDISPKFASFFRLIEQEYYLIDVENADFNTLLDKAEIAWSNREKISEELRLRIDVLKKLALSSNNFVLSLLR